MTCPATTAFYLLISVAAMITQFSSLPATCRSRIALAVVACCGLWLAADSRPAWCQATMTIDIVDEKDGEPIPCRIELRDAKGRPKKIRGTLNVPPWSIVDGQFIFRARQGDYEFEVTRGPEYAKVSGGFTLDRDGEGSDVVRLPRYADMASEGWFAGDLLAAVSIEDTGRWLPAEALHMASVFGKSNTVSQAQLPATASAAAAARDGSSASQKDDTAITAAGALQPPASRAETFAGGRWCNVGSYYDDRAGSGLILHHWLPPARVPETVPSGRLLTMAKQQGGTHAEIARLWADDAPIWLASGRIDSIQILSEHVTRDGRTPIKLSDMFHPEPNLFKGPRGPGRLVENLYWRVLETGLRIPPSAGSGAGRSTSPLGYNRVYVALPDGGPSDVMWWDALRQGRSFVTNGPLLRATVNSQLPGHTFRMFEGEKLMLDVALTLTVADPVEYVDVVFNGEAIYHARLDEYAKQGGKIPALPITQSGWLLIRVVTQHEASYRFATTAPYYVELDGKPRISRSACEMFLNWLEHSTAQRKKANPDAATAAAPYTSAALRFWRERCELANSD